jgi:hypothetical protein
VMHHERPEVVVPGVKMMGRDSETALPIHWDWVAASTVGEDRILMRLMILKLNHGYAKMRITKARITRVTCIILGAIRATSQNKEIIFFH